MPSVLIVEDHDYMASVLIRLLEKRSNLNVTARAKTAEEALDMLRELEVALLLVDVSLPNMNGIDLVAKLREEYPALPCLMLSGHHASHYVERALEVGARGYILKDDPEAIIEGIERVLEGEVYISKNLAY
jgi:DNA-binding NarL/FixJ family response regulator